MQTGCSISCSQHCCSVVATLWCISLLHHYALCLYPHIHYCTTLNFLQISRVSSAISTPSVVHFHSCSDFFIVIFFISILMYPLFQHYMMYTSIFVSTISRIISIIAATCCVCLGLYPPFWLRREPRAL